MSINHTTSIAPASATTRYLSDSMPAEERRAIRVAALARMARPGAAARMTRPFAHLLSDPLSPSGGMPINYFRTNPMLLEITRYLDPIDRRTFAEVETGQIRRFVPPRTSRSSQVHAISQEIAQEDSLRSLRWRMENNQTATAEQLVQYERLTGCEETFSSPEIRHIDLSDFAPPEHGNWTAIIRSLFRDFPNLESLDLSECNITNAELQTILQCLNERERGLSKLSLTHCRNFSGQALHALIQKCPHLLHLDLGSCHQLSADILSHIAQSCRQLRYLNLDDCRDANDAALNAIIQNCRQLEHLILSNCPAITDNALEDLARCSKLRSLYLAGEYGSVLSCNSFKKIVRNCRHLEELHIEDCPLDLFAIQALVENNRHLRRLSIRGSEITRSANAIHIIAKGFPQLESFCCTEISRTGVILLVQNCKELRSLNFLCRDFNNAVMREIGTNCPNLQYLMNGRVCPYVSNLGIEELARGTPRLSQLVLHGYTRITDAAIQTLVQHCPQLRWITITHAPQLTDKIIRIIARGCLQELRHLDVVNCPLILQTAMIRELTLDRCPRLERASSIMPTDH